MFGLARDGSLVSLRSHSNTLSHTVELPETVGQHSENAATLMTTTRPEALYRSLMATRIAARAKMAEVRR